VPGGGVKSTQIDWAKEGTVVRKHPTKCAVSVLRQLAFTVLALGMLGGCGSDDLDLGETETRVSPTTGWKEVNYCGPDDVCEPCDGDSECRQESECCGKGLYCFSRREENILFCLAGCTVPTPPPCRCQDHRCRFE